MFQLNTWYTLKKQHLHELGFAEQLITNPKELDITQITKDFARLDKMIVKDDFGEVLFEGRPPNSEDECNSIIEKISNNNVIQDYLRRTAHQVGFLLSCKAQLRQSLLMYGIGFTPLLIEQSQGKTDKAIKKKHENVVYFQRQDDGSILYTEIFFCRANFFEIDKKFDKLDELPTQPIAEFELISKICIDPKNPEKICHSPVQFNLRLKDEKANELLKIFNNKEPYVAKHIIDELGGFVHEFPEKNYRESKSRLSQFLPFFTISKEKVEKHQLREEWLHSEDLYKEARNQVAKETSESLNDTSLKSDRLVNK